MSINWMHSIENFFTVQDFWATCACPEKQSLSWNFSLYWMYFLHSGFLSNFCLTWKTELPWNFSLYWNIFHHSGFLSNLCIPCKQSFPWTFQFDWTHFLHSGFLSNLCLPWKTELPWNFPFYWIHFTFTIFEQLALALKNRVALNFFTLLKYLLSFKSFEQLVLALKTEFALKFFKPGWAAAPPRTPMVAHRNFVWYNFSQYQFFVKWS